MKKLSLQVRLILSFLLVASVVWLTAAVLSWNESREQLDEFFDTYQLQLARQLALVDWANVSPASQSKVNRLIDSLEDDGEEEDEAIGFAVFDLKGNMVFNDNENGRFFIFDPKADGFVTQTWGKKDDAWRILWMKSASEDYVVAVGQEMDYRNEAALEMVEENLLPWLLGLLLLMGATVAMVSSAFRPLKKITSELAQRSPKDLSLLPTNNLPSEILPLLTALNNLFLQIENTMKRERSFISDAAHELRTPLTALNVQSEVALLAKDDPETRDHALSKLNLGIERCSRLVGQLLALSRLEASTQFQEPEVVLDWQKLIDDAAFEQEETAATRNITIHKNIQGNGPVKEGRALLWSLLLRNLLDNALRYSPRGAEIDITLGEDWLRVYNSGVTVDNENLPRLGERFFRPYGQEQNGSGLGLSIVKRIAALHNCSVKFTNDKDGFAVIITPEQ